MEFDSKDAVWAAMRLSWTVLRGVSITVRTCDQRRPGDWRRRNASNGKVVEQNSSGMNGAEMNVGWTSQVLMRDT